jgi:hypothetical protein
MTMELQAFQTRNRKVLALRVNLKAVKAELEPMPPGVQEIAHGGEPFSIVNEHGYCESVADGRWLLYNNDGKVLDCVPDAEFQKLWEPVESPSREAIIGALEIANGNVAEKDGVIAAMEKRIAELEAALVAERDAHTETAMAAANAREYAQPGTVRLDPQPVPPTDTEAPPPAENVTHQSEQ